MSVKSNSIVLDTFAAWRVSHSHLVNALHLNRTIAFTFPFTSYLLTQTHKCVLFCVLCSVVFVGDVNLYVCLLI